MIYEKNTRHSNYESKIKKTLTFDELFPIQVRLCK